MSETNGVVWCYSLYEPDVIFIFRNRDIEFKINLKEQGQSLTTYKHIWLLNKERELLSKLIKAEAE